MNTVLGAPDVLFGRGDMLQWSRYERTDDPNEAAKWVFEVWERGERNIFSGSENTAIYTRSEAEDYLKVLVENFNNHTVEVDSLESNFEIRSLRKALREGR